MIVLYDTHPTPRPTPEHGSPNTGRDPHAPRRGNSSAVAIGFRLWAAIRACAGDVRPISSFLICGDVGVRGWRGGGREVRERWREAAIMIVSFDYYVFLLFFVSLSFFVRIGSVGVKWRRCLMKVLEPDFSEKCNTDTKTEVLIMMSASLEADIYHGRKKKHFVINNTRSYHIQFVINNTSSQKQTRPQQASAEA